MTTLGIIKKGAVALGLIAGLGSAVMANAKKDTYCYKRNGVTITEATALANCSHATTTEVCYTVFGSDCETLVTQVSGTWTGE